MLLALGTGTSVLVGLGMRLSEGEAPRQPRGQPQGAPAVETDPRTGLRPDALALANVPDPERERRFWSRALAIGFVAWAWILLGAAIGGTGPFSGDLWEYAGLALYGAALPFAIGCRIASSRCHDRDPARSIAWLKRPFYYGFAGLVLLFVLSWVERAIDVARIGKYLSM